VRRRGFVRALAGLVVGLWLPDWRVPGLEDEDASTGITVFATGDVFYVPAYSAIWDVETGAVVVL